MERRNLAVAEHEIVAPVAPDRRCVAVELAEERAPGDLRDPPPRAGYIAGP